MVDVETGFGAEQDAWECIDIESFDEPLSKKSWQDPDHATSLGTHPT